MTGGKSGSPGGGIPANQLWWRIPLALSFAAIMLALILSPLALIDYLIEGRL